MLVGLVYRLLLDLFDPYLLVISVLESLEVAQPLLLGLDVIFKVFLELGRRAQLSFHLFLWLNDRSGIYDI